MDVETGLSNVAFLLGEPARALMLWSLLDGQARPAGELAFFANVSPQSASLHLAKLVEAEMLKVTAQGRNRYYAIARPEVAHAIESMAALIPSASKTGTLPSFAVPGLRLARTCYDHLAGKLAVDMADSMQERGLLSLSGSEFLVTEKGEKLFGELGVSIDEVRRRRRSFAGKCLDWSERRYHVAGALGSALLDTFLDRKWIARVEPGRAVRVTLEGRKGFDKLFGMTA